EPPKNAHTLQRTWMQKHGTAGSGGSTTVRAALHAVPGRKLLGNAQGDSAGQRSAGSAAGNHAIHYGERRAAGARGDERIDADRRFEGANPQYVFDVDEPSGEPGSRVHEKLAWTDQRASLNASLRNCLKRQNKNKLSPDLQEPT